MRNLLDRFRFQPKIASVVDPLEITTDQERRKVFLRYLNRGWFIFGIVTLVSLPIFSEHQDEFIFLIALIFPTYLITRVLNLSGRTRFAGVVFTLSVNFGFYGLFLLLVRELGAYQAFESQSTVWMLMGLAVIFAGALFDKWAAPGLAALNSILLILTRFRLAPDSDPRPSALVFWWMMALTIWLYERTLGQAFEGVLAEHAEYKQAEENLRTAEIKYRTIVEQIHPIVYIASPYQNIGVTYVSPQIKTLGFTEEEWIADPELWLRQVHPDDQKKVMEYLEQVSQTREPYKLEYRLRTRDGIIRWILDEVVNITDKDDNVLFHQGFMLDITERKQAEDEIRRRERYFTLLNQITHSILAVGDINETYQNMARDLVKLFESDDCYIIRWDEKKQQTILLVSTPQLEQPYLSSNFKPGDFPVTAAIMNSGQVLVVDDMLNSPYLNSDLTQELPIRSALGIPLIVKENKYGAILIAFNTPYHFSTEEIERAKQTGQQIALALWTVQQEAEIQKRLKESNALTKITHTLSETEHIGLQTILQLIVSSAKELIPATEQAVIHLLDEEQQILIAKAVVGYKSEIANGKFMKIRPNKGVAGQVIVSGETINIEDIMTDSRFLASDSPPSYRSLMVAPVQSGDRMLGTISVQSSLVSAFTEDESSLLSSLGTQAAIAIENANLLENIQQTLKEVNALYRVNQGLVASLETDRLLQDTVELLQKNFGYYHVQIYVIEPETQDIVLRAGSSANGIEVKELGHRLHAGDGITGYTAETGEPFFTNDVDKVHFFIRNPVLPDTKSELAVPVKISGHVLGVLDIQQVPPGYLTQRDIQLVSSVADQLAVALQKADLYEELQVSLQQEKAIRNQLVQNERLAVMGRLLASVSHELNNPLQAIQNALFLLKEEKGISSQGKSDLDIVLAESERMGHMIEQLRDTYRPIQTEDFHPTQINNIVEDVHTLISTHLRHNQITFEFHPNPDLPPILALSDQIRQVVLNLFMNAVEAMSAGGKLSIDTNLADEDNEVLLTISDTGPGISPAILPNIFEAFVTDKQKGTGLGLTITYDIVLKHRGRITAQNNMERGSTFKVWLPIKSREIE